MVLNNHSYEEQTRRRLAEAQSELGALDVEIRKLEDGRTELKAEVEAYETILRAYRKRTGKEEVGLDWDKLLADKTHRERLIVIAQRTGGTVKTTYATDLLYTKGFMKSKRRSNAYSIVQHLLADMTAEGKFERVSGGEYRLRGR